MRKINVLVLFGGMSPEHEVSLRSAESVLNHMSKEKYNILPVGITKEGAWILYGGHDYSRLLFLPFGDRAFCALKGTVWCASLWMWCSRFSMERTVRTEPCRACCSWPVSLM